MRPSFGMAAVVVITAIVVSGGPSLAHAQAKALRNTLATFVNSSSRNLHELYVAPADRPAWGPNQLDGGILAAGETIAMQGLRCDSYKILVVDEDGDSCVITEVPLCNQGSVLLTNEILADCPGPAGSRTPTIVNDSKLDVQHLYLAPPSSSEWGPDELAEGVLAAGEQLELAGTECALYRMRLVDPRGIECVLEAVDVCPGITGWHLTDELLKTCPTDRP